jgi:hypothetical protein
VRSKNKTALVNDEYTDINVEFEIVLPSKEFIQATPGTPV